MIRRFARLLLLAAGLVAPGLACAQSSGQAPATLIRGARVFDGEQVVGPANVLIEDGRIAAVGPDVEAPAGADVVDAAGMTLMPGLIDAHAHSFADALTEALVFGVTTELDMFTDARMAEALRAEQRAGPVTGRADLFSAGVLATAPGGHGTEYGMQIPTISDPAGAQAFVDARIAEGSDWIKIVYDDGALFGLSWPTIDRATLVALVEAAHARDRLAVVHVSTLAQARDAIDAGADGLVHLFTDSLPPAAFIESVRANGAIVVPTLVVLKSITGEGGAAPLAAEADLAPYLQPTSAANLERAFPAGPDAAERFAIPLRTVAQLHEAGVPVLAGTDAPNPGTAHGIAMHRELELLVEAGLSPEDALRAATAAPADAFGLDDRGRIAPGMRADLLLVRGDALSDITATRAIEGVWKAGTRLDRAAWRQSATAAREAAGRAPSGIGDGTIADFEDGTPGARFGTEWMVNTDAFIGGTSTAALDVVEVEGGRALQVSGTITDATEQPWAGAMWSPGSQMMQPANLSSAPGLSFRVRGDGRTNRVLVFAERNGYTPQMHDFVAPAEWTEVTLPWSTFGTDGSDVMAILFVGGLPAGEFRFEIDDIAIR